MLHSDGVEHIPPAMTHRSGNGLTLTPTLVALALTLGCSAREPGDRATDSSARNQALITAGNTAYRSGNYQVAAKRYAAAAVAKQDDPAAHYGLGMALSKLGRIDEARRAYARARELARGKPRRRRRLAAIPRTPRAKAAVPGGHALQGLWA